MIVYAFLAALFILNLTSVPVPDAGMIKPHLVLMAVYYWAIFRPTLIPTWLCFVVGILLDSLSGMPLGLQAFVLVAAQSLVRDQRKFLMAQPYISVWAIFGLVVGMAALVQWALFGLANDMQWLPLLPIAASVIMTFCLFPLVSMALIATHRMLSPGPRGSYS